jgi:hypothetical protein
MPGEYKVKIISEYTLFINAESSIEAGALALERVDKKDAEPTKTDIQDIEQVSVHYSRELEDWEDR